jgi:hypothetical protein
MVKTAIDDEIVMDAYAQALLAAKTKGMDGDVAKVAARGAAARALTKAFRTPITADTVADIVERF